MSGGFLSKLGLHRPELRAWAIYDWANSVFMTTGLLIFPVYFSDVAGAGLAAGGGHRALQPGHHHLHAAGGRRFAHPGRHRRLPGHEEEAADLLHGHGRDRHLGLVLRRAAATGSWPSRSSWWPTPASRRASCSTSRCCRTSPARTRWTASPPPATRSATSGSSLLMLLHVAWIQKPAWFGIPSQGMAIRLAFLTSGLWWAAFTIPLLAPRARAAAAAGGGRARRHEPRRASASGAWARRCARCAATSTRSCSWWPSSSTTTASAPSSAWRRSTGARSASRPARCSRRCWWCSWSASPSRSCSARWPARSGPSASIFITLAVYLVISVLGYRMTTARDFFVLAALVGTVQGGSQALSRSVFSTMVPKHKSSEFFAFFSVFEKFAGIVGPVRLHHRRERHRLQPQRDAVGGRLHPGGRQRCCSS